MNKVFSFALAAALMMAAACSEPLNEVAEEAIHQNRVGDEQVPQYTFTPEELGYLTELANGTPKISVDSAAKVALMVMGNGSTLSKRSLSVTAFGTPKSTSLTKSFTDSDIDTTFYVFNAPGDNGFAVISADARIPQQVLAFSETGNLELDSDNPAFDVFLDYTQNYAAHCIAKAQEQRDSIINSIYEKFGITVDVDSANSLSKTKHVIQRFLLTCQCYTNTSITTISEVKPLITTNWYQRQPYNGLVGSSKNCPNGYAAGCVSIATAQFMVYWRYPQAINGIKFDWGLLSNDRNIHQDEYKEQTASLVSFIGKTIGTDYGCSSSSAETADATRLLIGLGYFGSSKLSNYKYEKVTSCLDKGWPVIMRGNRTKKKFIVTWYKNGHAWLADGYVHQRIATGTTLTYVVVEVDDETGRGSCRFERQSGGGSVTEPQYLHLNWGWGENSNGYFSKDVFYAKERYELGSDGKYVRNETDKDYNYQYNLEIAENLHR